MQARVRLEKAAHQRRIAGDDHDEAVAMVLHPLQQRLDRLRAEVLPARVAARERVRLVDEEHAVERALDRAVRLDRRRADVLADEPGAIYFDEMAALEQSHRAVHLREQARDRRLARARVAEEDEVLARRDLREPVLLPARLHLEERGQRTHLLLHRFEPDQRVELGLSVVERVAAHARTLPLGVRSFTFHRCWVPHPWWNVKDLTPFRGRERARRGPLRAEAWRAPRSPARAETARRACARAPAARAPGTPRRRDASGSQRSAAPARPRAARTETTECRSCGFPRTRPSRPSPRPRARPGRALPRARR